MSLSIETILSDARKLVIRLKEHDATADCLVARTQSLQKQLDAMKQVKF
jgi:SIKE family